MVMAIPSDAAYLAAVELLLRDVLHGGCDDDDVVDNGQQQE